jgi:hypothetical protein
LVAQIYVYWGATIAATFKKKNWNRMMLIAIILIESRVNYTLF